MLFFSMLSVSIRLPLYLRPIEEQGWHPTIKCRINGKPCVLLVDTGASRTVFDQERIRLYIGSQKTDKHEKVSSGLGTNSMLTETTVLNKFKLGTLLLEKYSAVILDLSHVNMTYREMGLPPIDGVLGSDVLFRYKATLDYKKKELILRKKQL